MTAYSPIIQISVNGSLTGDEIDVNTLSITGGRANTGYQPDPMVATVDLLPSTSYPTYDLNDELEIQIIDPSTSLGVNIFKGYISDINFNYYAFGNGNGQRRYTITAQDPTSILAFQSFYPGTPSFVQNDAGMQLALGLGYTNFSTMSIFGTLPYTTYPTLSPTIDSAPGATYDLDAISPAQTDIIGDFCRDTANMVNGVMYYKPQDGMIWFDGVTRRSGRTAFTLGSNEIKPDINLSRSIGMIINRAKVTRAGGDKYASSTTSQNIFGRRWYQTDTRLHLASDAQTKATNIVSAFAGVSAGVQAKVWRPSTITVDLHNPNLTDAKRSSLINVFCGSRVDVTVPDPENVGSMGQITLSCYIEGWTWSFGMKQASITMNLALVSDVPQ